MEAPGAVAELAVMLRVTIRDMRSTCPVGRARSFMLPLIVPNLESALSHNRLLLTNRWTPRCTGQEGDRLEIEAPAKEGQGLAGRVS